jgi:hypothetical protein
LYQGIEDLNVNNGTYCVSWVGSDITAQYLLSTDTTANNGWDGVGTFQTVANGGTFTVNESPEHGKHLWIRFSGTLSNLDKVMVEEGTVPTPFEHRPYGTELALCQRYYEVVPRIYIGSNNSTVNFTQIRHTMTYATQKRTSPAVTYGTITAGFSVSSLLTNTTHLIFEIGHSGTTDFRPGITTNTTISAEL